MPARSTLVAFSLETAWYQEASVKIKEHRQF